MRVFYNKVIVEQSVQTASTPFNIFENKGQVELIFNESLNQFKLDSTRFQEAFNIFTLSTMLDNLFKCIKQLVQQSVECKLKQMLKPFKQAFINLIILYPIMGKISVYKHSSCYHVSTTGSIESLVLVAIKDIIVRTAGYRECWSSLLRA